MRLILLGLVLSVVMFFVSSCTDSTDVGTGLVTDEEIELEYSEDFEISAKILEVGAPITYTRQNNVMSTYYAGMIDDPIFGTVEASFCFQMLYTSDQEPEYENKILDSVTLMLDYLPARTYGDSLASFDVEIYRLRENLTGRDSIRSGHTYSTDSEPLVVLEDISPGRNDTIRLSDPSTDRDFVLTDLIRTIMPRSFSFELFNDTEAFGSNEVLSERFNGFCIKVSSAHQSLMAFDLTGVTSSHNFLSVFYHEETDTNTVYRREDYALGGVRPVSYQLDHDGTTVAEKINQEVTADDLLYIQGFSGPVVELDLSDARRLDGNLINHAEIELTLAEDHFPSSDPFTPANYLGLYYMDDEGSLQPISDLDIGERRGGSDLLFGGQLSDDDNETLRTYTVKLSAYIKDLIKGTVSPKLYLTIRNRYQTAERTLIYSPQHTQYPLKLKINYTKA